MDKPPAIRVSRNPLEQPGGEGVHLRQLLELRSDPPLVPAADLAIDEAGRLAERGERTVRDVDIVEIGQRIDQRFADAPPGLWMIA